MRRRFDEELQLLNKKLIEMGAQCEEVIRLAAAGLTEGRAEQVQKVKPMDAEIDRIKIYPIKWTQQEEGFLENGHKQKG